MRRRGLTPNTWNKIQAFRLLFAAAPHVKEKSGNRDPHDVSGNATTIGELLMRGDWRSRWLAARAAEPSTGITEGHAVILEINSPAGPDFAPPTLSTTVGAAERPSPRPKLRLNSEIVHMLMLELRFKLQA